MKYFFRIFVLVVVFLFSLFFLNSKFNFLDGVFNKVRFGSLSEKEEMGEDLLNQQIQDFLNSEGEYTDEKIQEMIIQKAFLDSSLYNDFNKETRLGLVERDSECALVEGILLGMEKKMEVYCSLVLKTKMEIEWILLG